MKVLILSCNTGEGHNYAGRALKECIESHHDTADMLDIMMLASPRVSKLVGNSYVNIVRHAPRLFSVYTNWADLSVPPDIILRFIMPMLFSPKANALSGYTPLRCNRNAPSFPAQTLTYIKKKNLLSQKVVAVETDYTCIPFGKRQTAITTSSLTMN